MINNTRLEFWFYKTARSFNGVTPKKISIHDVINSKVKNNLTRQARETSNTITLIKSLTKRMATTEALNECSKCNGSDHRRKQRVMMWLNKINRRYKHE